MPRDAFCHACGAPFSDTSRYPRRCAQCRTEVWANPIPVTIALVPVLDGARTGLLVVRRAIQPQLGKLGLVGGFLEDHESWTEGAARETREEAGVRIDPSTITPLWFSSSAPRPNRVLLFGVAACIDVATLPPFVPSSEASERGLVYGPSGLEDVFAFGLHVEAARRWMHAQSIVGPHDYRVR
ncbi:MAG: NUDIX domain-containing protein [Sandaracinaceae bacterium]|jgi:ADP-ribose pyrophosphatase YjhB (NUDIX family)|nr:NUDIX domain-containing protein [Sandaracinaceae bacterium]